MSWQRDLIGKDIPVYCIGLNGPRRLYYQEEEQFYYVTTVWAPVYRVAKRLHGNAYTDRHRSKTTAEAYLRNYRRLHTMK